MNILEEWIAEVSIMQWVLIGLGIVLLVAEICIGVWLIKRF